MAKQIGNKAVSFYWFFLLLLPGSYLLYFANIHDPVMAPRFVFDSLLLAFVTWRYRTNLFAERISLNITALALLTYYVITLLSVPRVYNPEDGLFDAQKTLLPFAAFVLLTAVLKKHPASLQAVFKSILWLSLITIAVALLQTAQVVANGVLTEESVYEIKGLSAHRNLLAAHLFMLMGFNIAAYMTAESYKRLHGVAAIGCVFIILILQTRTELVGMLVSSVTMGWLFIRFIRSKTHPIIVNWRIALVTVMLVAAVITIYLLAGDTAALFERLNPANFMSSATAGERFKLWRGSYKMIEENFWLGTGAGNWKFVFPKYTLDRLFRAQLYGYVFVQPHNDYLWVFCETGLIGFTAFVIPQLFTYIQGIQFLKRPSQNEVHKRIVWVLLALFAGFALISSLDFLKERAEHLVFYALLLALLHQFASQVDWFGNRFALHVKRDWFCAGLVMLLAANVVIGVFQFSGQYHNLNVVKAQKESNWKLMLAEAKAAENILYKVDPVSMPIRWFCGMANYAMNDIDQAILDFEAAYKRNPYSFHILNNLGGVYTYRNRFNEALPLFREAVRINSSFDDAIYNLAFTYYKLNDPDSALLTIQKVNRNDEKKKLFEEKILELRRESGTGQSSTISN